MKAQQRPLVIFSAFIALSIAIAGSYYSFVGFGSQNNDITMQNLPKYADGATHIISTDVYTGQPDNFTSEFKRSEIVVEGVIDHIYPARWTTPDGNTPENLTTEDLKNLALHIRTPVQLSVKHVFKGQPVNDTLKFSFIGGRVDDTAQVFTWNDVFEQGATVIVFLAKGEAGSPAHNVESQGLYPRMHLVVKGDVVQGPIKEIQRADLLQQLQ